MSDPAGDTAMLSNRDRLVYMANQIARNLAVMGEVEAAAATADHLTAYWDPRMKQQILVVLHADPEALSKIARRAIEAFGDEANQATGA